MGKQLKAIQLHPSSVRETRSLFYDQGIKVIIPLGVQVIETNILST